MVNDECYENAAGNMCNSHGTTVRWINFGFLQFHECIVENERGNASCIIQCDALRRLKRWMRLTVFISKSKAGISLTDGFNFILRGSKQENQILRAVHWSIDKKYQK